jgi:hypothetical protein
VRPTRVLHPASRSDANARNNQYTFFEEPAQA